MFIRLVAILIISGTHGFVVATLANLRGDAEPAHAGRRTPSPFVHLDLVGGACLLLFGLGWIRPIQIEPDQLRSPRRDLILIGAAGLASVLLVGFLSYQLRSLAVAALPSGPGIAVAATLQTTATLAISFCLFNLLPLPPLTGRYFLYAIFPGEVGRTLERYTPHAAVGVGLLIITGVLPSLVAPTLRTLSNHLLGAF